jgi:peroxiredoxin
VIILSLTLNDSSFKFSNQVAIKDNLPAPDFTFPRLDGKMVSLSDYKGKVVLVNIWATWCPPCVDEMPSMEKLYRKFKGKNFEILAVSIDEPGLKAVAPFMKKSNLTFPALIDSEGAVKAVYGITGIPESFIIDQQGLLLKKIVGPVDWATPNIFRFFSELIQKPLPR